MSDPRTQLAALSGDPFVGRASEMAALRRGLESVLGGRGRLFLLIGEPGIGKTRLADEISEEAQRQGARVLWGRCWESGGAPAFWPWTQLIRSSLSSRSPSATRSETGTGIDPEAILAAMLEGRSSDTDSFVPEQARFQLFDEIARYLRSTADARPLVLILDDLHAADIPSLLLLRFLARELRSAAWLLIGTYRDVEAAANPELARLLADIAREGQRLPLSGLSQSETGDYISTATATSPAAPVVEAVHRVTEGNPFFLTEIVRLLDRLDPANATGSVRHLIPDEVRAAIRQRLAGLSPLTKRMLAIAAVIGRELDAEVLARAASVEIGVGDLPQLLDEACAGGAIAPVSGSPRRYRFSHLLVRDTLYDDLSTTERARLHRQVAQALERHAASAPAAHLAEIAFHFGHAAAAGCIDQAMDYSQRAGDQAVGRLAYEEAARHYRRALDCLDLRRLQPAADDLQRRCHLLLSLGEAQWGAGDLAAMRTTFLNTARLAETLDEAHRGVLLARAALGLGGRQQRAHVSFDDTVVEWLEKALLALGDHDSVLRARLLARLAYALYSQRGSQPRRRALCAEAVAMARRLGDRQTLRWVLNDWRWALWGPDNLDDRLRIGEELILLAEQFGDREMLLTEHAWRLVDFLELGDLAAVKAELAAFSGIAQEIRLPWYHWYVSRFGAMLAVVRGELTESERLAETALATAERVQHQDAFLVYATQIMAVRFEQGRLDELEIGLQALIAQYPAVPVWRYLLIYLHAEQGHAERSRVELERIGADGFRDVPDDYLRTANLAYLAEAAAFLGDRKRAEQLYPLLLPYRSRCIVLGYGIACLGPVARPLGRLATTLERWQEATELLTEALQASERLGHEPARARTELAIAELLLRRPGADGERRRQASAMLDACRARCAAIGMTRVGLRAEELARPHGLQAEATVKEPSLTATTDSSTAAVVGRFRQDGEYWDIAFGKGAPFRLKNLRGLAYVAHLLKHPEQEFHVSQMVALFETEPEAAEPARRRIALLREELATAEANRDSGRAAVLENELDRLLGQWLETSDEKAGERARISVTKRISIALQRLTTHDPALGRHLETSIRTGSFCCYAPDRTIEVRWEL